MATSPETPSNKRKVVNTLIQFIIDYANTLSTSDFIKFAFVGMSTLFFFTILFNRNFLIILLSSLLVLCLVSFVILHFKVNKRLAGIILNGFVLLVFGDSEIIATHLGRGDRTRLSLSLCASLKLLSICGTITSLALLTIALDNTADNLQATSTPYPVVATSEILPTNIITYQLQTIQAPQSTPQTTQLTDNSNITSTKNFFPTVEPAIILESQSITSSSKYAIKLAVTITSSSHLTSVIDGYKESLTAIMPRVAIAEVKKATLSNYINTQDEYIVLVNYGEYIDLSGWYIADFQGNIFRFENFYLNQASFVRLHTGQGDNTAYDLYWNMSNSLWAQAELNLILVDNFGNTVDRGQNYVAE